MHYFWLVVMMISCGVLGGSINFFLDKCNFGKDEKKRNNLFEYMVIGIGASLLVPLFLNMIGSTLIESSDSDHGSTLVIMGFCLVAAMTSRNFIKDISDKALQKAQQAENKANEIEQTVNLAEKRQNAIIMPVVMIELGKFEQAVTDLDKTLHNDPTFAEAWAWRGYAQKRLENYEEAVISMERAISHEENPDLLWHYNLACYKALAKRNIKDIAKNLEVIKRSSDPRRNELLSYLTTDTDFDQIRSNKVFQTYARCVVEEEESL